MTPTTKTESGDYTSARLQLQRVATHVLARARFRSDGRFGLRVTADGIGTPAFGPTGDVLRIAAGTLVREHQEKGSVRSASMPIASNSLMELGAFAGVDMMTTFSAGEATPPVGDPDARIDLPPEGTRMVLRWLRFGAEVLDCVLVQADDPSVIQLWPEHFDVGVDVETILGRVNLGASPGDAQRPGPYLYVSPWEAARPGHAAFWNAPFGAALDAAALKTQADPLQAAIQFFTEALRQFR